MTLQFSSNQTKFDRLLAFFLQLHIESKEEL